MTNKEKYREELESYAFADAPLGIDTKGNVMCGFLAGNECTHCIFGEKAEFEREKMIVLEQMKKYAEPEDAVWDLKKAHWSISYNFYHKKIVIIPNTKCKCNEIYFSLLEDAERCITEVGEDRIKKYYCGVKE